MPNNIDLDITEGFSFWAKGRAYTIQAGHVRTSHIENDGVVWDWQVALELKKSDIIPSNEATAILYDDNTVFLKTRVIERKQEGGLTVIKLVPFMQEGKK